MSDASVPDANDAATASADTRVEDFADAERRRAFAPSKDARVASASCARVSANDARSAPISARERSTSTSTASGTDTRAGDDDAMKRESPEISSPGFAERFPVPVPIPVPVSDSSFSSSGMVISALASVVASSRAGLSFGISAGISFGISVRLALGARIRSSGASLSSLGTGSDRPGSGSSGSTAHCA